MGGKLHWHGEQARAMVLARVTRLLSAAALIVSTRAKQLLSVAGTGHARDKATGKFKRSYGANPSAPGEPPAKQTGRLRASVAWEVAGLVARVGTNVRYGRWLEFGTSRMAARPWLRRALAETRGRILALFRNAENV